MRELKKIACVEDEADIREIVHLALELVGGYETALYASGHIALNQLEIFAPDLIVLDVMMPDMDGTTTFAHLRQNPALAHIPVVFMTAKVQPSEVTALRALGALDVIAKPFDPMTLASQLHDLWQKHHAN